MGTSRLDPAGARRAVRVGSAGQPVSDAPSEEGTARARKDRSVAGDHVSTVPGRAVACGHR
jgi:hypothetical protein